MTYEVNGFHYSLNEPITIQVSNGLIDKIKPYGGNEKNLPLIGPGLVDIQINGYFGVDFNSTNLSPPAFKKAVKELWKRGVTTFFPTLITNSDEMIEKNIKVIKKASEDPLVNFTVQGIHIEGPFISPEDGPRGAHDLQFVRKPNWELFTHWQELAGGRIKMITISPEWPSSVNFIEKCVENEVIVSIGHTAATTEQIREAVEAGARLSTHLGNGAHLTLPRHPNYLWDQLAQDKLWASYIGDGFHLPDSVIKVINKVKGKKAILVSDAVYLSGLAPGKYKTHIGGRVQLRENGKLHLADNPKILAGSAQSLPVSIQTLINKGLLNLEEAWNAASIFPAELTGLPVKESLKEGAPADLILFKFKNGNIDVQETFKSGVSVYKNPKKSESYEP